MRNIESINAINQPRQKSEIKNHLIELKEKGNKDLAWCNEAVDDLVELVFNYKTFSAGLIGEINYFLENSINSLKCERAEEIDMAKAEEILGKAIKELS